MDNRPIGVFDSGLGGLTFVKEIKKLMPKESIIYFGDTSRVPYGTRSKETVLKYAIQDINLLLTYNIKAIVVACGTVSAVALDILKDKIDIPIIGVVLPAALRATNASKSKRIGVFGTAATIKSNAYKNALLKYDKDILAFSLACPMFVPLVENGYFKKGNDVATIIAKEYLAPLLDANVDTIILGCTHYPLLTDIITDNIPSNIRLIDAGKSAAIMLTDYLLQNELQAKDKEYTDKFLVSDSLENFSNLAEIFLGISIKENIELIDINSYDTILRKVEKK
ncbi:MAG: glutamate racemase [Clostridia bacterium]